MTLPSALFSPRPNRNALVDRYRIKIFLVVFAIWDVPMMTFWILVWQSGDLPSIGFWFLMIAISIIPFLVPASSYRLSAFEASGEMYKAIGVRYIKRWVTHGEAMNRWIRRRDPEYRVIQNRQSLHGFLKKVRFVERWHLAMFLFTFGTALYATTVNWNFWSTYLHIANIVVNLYPVLLQRYSRARMKKLGVQ